MSEPATPDRAQPFRDMAERIARNKGEEFGGALLVVSPDGSVLDFVLLGSKADIVAFWGAAKVRVEIAAQDAIRREETAHQPAYGRR